VAESLITSISTTGLRAEHYCARSGLSGCRSHFSFISRTSSSNIRFYRISKAKDYARKKTVGWSCSGLAMFKLSQCFNSFFSRLQCRSSLLMFLAMIWNLVFTHGRTSTFFPDLPSSTALELRVEKISSRVTLVTHRPSTSSQPSTWAHVANKNLVSTLSHSPIGL
jgi:hypothetical protein